MSALSQHVDARLCADAPGKRVQDVVCTEYGISRHLLIAVGRDPLIVEARRVAIWLLVKDLRLGYTAAGRLMRRDHSTIIHHCNRMSTKPTEDELVMLAQCRAVLSPTVRTAPVRTLAVRRMA